jgi:hypothetical protein
LVAVIATLHYILKGCKRKYFKVISTVTGILCFMRIFTLFASSAESRVRQILHSSSIQQCFLFSFLFHVHENFLCVDFKVLRDLLANRGRVPTKDLKS